MTGKTKPRKPQRKKNRVGAMAVIGGLLLVSAALRLSLGADAAFALAEVEKGHSGATALKAGTGPIGVTADDIQPILDALKAREDRLEKREQAIEVRMKALQLAEEEIDKKLATLVKAEEDLRSTMAIAQTAAEDDLTRLTDVYASMKPKQAAALFEEMDPDFAAGFLGRMRPEPAAAILAGLSPNAAYSISVILAGRNAEVPKE